MTPEKRREVYGLLCDALPILRAACAEWPDSGLMAEMQMKGAVNFARAQVEEVKILLETAMDEDAS